MVNYRKIADIDEYAEVAQVATVTEAARMCYVDRQTILYNINMDYVAARKVNGMYLVSVSSLKRIYPNMCSENLLQSS